MTTRAVLVSIGILTAAITYTPVLTGQVRVEAVPELCSGLSPEEKPVVGVMNFDVKVDVTGDVGGGMASMLTNALLNSGCFTVVERARLDDVMNEQAFGLSGAVEDSSAAATGRIAGARYQIMGEVTEFSENTSGVGGAARTFGRMLGGFGAAAGAVDVRNAHVGFIIRIVDTSSAIVLGSQSFDKQRRSTGIAASTWWGNEAFAGAGEISQAMADAIEEGIIEATSYLAPYRDRMAEATREVLAANPSVEVPAPGECSLLREVGRPLRVMVMIPEEHITGLWGAYAEDRAFAFDEYEGNRNANPSNAPAGSGALAAAQRMIRPPDPAGETEIVKRFLEHGFTVVDPAQYERLRADERYLTVNDDAAYASEVGREHGADIVITGEAFSEFSRNMNGLMSSRARVEAKAIEASTARIIAADGLHAGHVDTSEVIAGKGALRDAGGLVADYFLAQICLQSAGSFGSAGGVGIASSAGEGALELIVSQVDFAGSSNLQRALEALAPVSAVERRSFRDGTVAFRVVLSGTADELAEAMLADTTSFPLDIVSFDAGRIVAAMR